MSRSTQSNRQRQQSSRRPFGMEAMETRVLMAGDVMAAVDTVEVEPTPAAEIGRTESMPQTKEHILLSRQVDVPADTSELDVNANEEEGVLVGLLLPAVQKVRDAAAMPAAENNSDELPCSPGTTVETACDVLAPQTEETQETTSENFTLNYEPIKHNDAEQSSGMETPPEGELPCSPGTPAAIPCDIKAPEFGEEAESGFVPGDKLFDPTRDPTVDPRDPANQAPPADDPPCSVGTTVETPCDVLAPEIGEEAELFVPSDKLFDPTRDPTVDPRDPANQAPPADDPPCSVGTTVETPCDVLAPEIGEEAELFVPSDKLFDPTRDPTVDPRDPANQAPPADDPPCSVGTTVETPCDVLAPEIGEEEYLAGDTNLDGRVDFGDFLAVSGNFGQEVEGRAQGDLNGDGRVSFEDFLEVAANFGLKPVAADAVFAAYA